ncbi:MAG: copper amine oxidase N-terminal domain-containing protein [Candidatus Cryosericum sp.]
MRYQRASTHLIVVLMMLLALVLPSPVAASSSSMVVKLWVGNSIMDIGGLRQPIDSEGTKPVIVEGRTLVPIRAIIEAFNGSVAWDATERRVTVTLGANALDLSIGKSTASLNGTTLPVDAANPRVIPVIMSGRTMLPLRFVSESLGIDVQYEAATKMITLTYAIDMAPLAPAAPLLAWPDDGKTFVNELPKLSWLPVMGTDASRVQIMSSGVEVLTKSNLKGTDYIVPENLLADGTYAWRVSVHNGSGWGGWSEMRIFTLATITLAAPSLLSPADNSSVCGGAVRLVWASVGGANAYRVRVLHGTDEAYVATDITEASCTIPSSTLVVGGYSWQVGVYSTSVWSDWSTAWRFSVEANALSAPSSLNVASTWNAPSPAFPAGYATIALSWTPVSGATGYEIWARSSNGASGSIGGVESPATSFNSISLVNGGGGPYVRGTTYYFKIRTVSDCGNSTFTREVSCIAGETVTSTGDGAISATPVLSSPLNGATVATEKVVLSWNPASGASGYEVQWGKSTNFERTIKVNSSVHTWTTEYGIGGGATYYWRVRAVGSTLGVFSPWSSTWSFTTPNSLAVGTCILHHDGLFGAYVSCVVANMSEYQVSSATISFAALDGNGKITRVGQTLHDIAGGQVVTVFVDVPSDTVGVVFIGLTIP